MSRPSRLAAVLHRYGITDAHAFRPLTRGLLNLSYRVDTGQGRYFLKHYLDPDITSIVAEHRATRLLAAAGLPAVTPLADRHGRTLVRRDGRFFALFPWRDGRHRFGADLDLAECSTLGATLAALHRGLARALTPCQQELFVPTTDPDSALDYADHLLRLIRGRAVRDAFDDLAEYRLIERRARLRELVPLRPPDADAPHVGYVHGDFHALNVLYAGSRITAVVDWDQLSVRPYIDEVVRAAILFFIDEHEGALDLERVHAFAAGYASQNPEIAGDFEVGVRRVWWERLTDFWMLRWHYERGDRRSDPLFPAAAGLVAWWTERYEKVLEAFIP